MMKFIVAILLGIVGHGTFVQAQQTPIDIRAFENVRIEQEDKILVPEGKADEVWKYITERYLNQEHVKTLDPEFSTYHHDEQFEDRYFDTPDLFMLGKKSGIRHRKRENLTDPTDRKDGRELVQIKLNNISDNPLERAEIKFDVEYPLYREGKENTHPLIGVIKESDRRAFFTETAKLGIDPFSLRPVVTLHNLRRRVYFKKGDQPFMSISFDYVNSNVWWAKANFVEIEPELNEEQFTAASPETRRYMEEKLHLLMTDLKTKFPYLQTNLTPKYNKTFERIEHALPFFRFLVQIYFHTVEGMLLVIAGILALIGGVGYAIRARILAARTKKHEAELAS